MVKQPHSVIVIGGGVVGAACAYYLAKAGCQVRVLERNKFGSGASHGNCGFVCPSHLLPLTSPAGLREAAKSLFQRNGPLSIRPGFNFGLWRWLLHFAIHCRRGHMLAVAEARRQLLNASKELYDELRRQDGFDCEWQDQGVLFVYNSPRRFEDYAATAEMLRTRFGLEAKCYEGDDLTAFEPALKPGLAGGWHFPGDSHLRPDKLMTSWRTLLQSAGVEVVENVRVDAFDCDNDGIRGLATSQGRMQADAYVLATGALAPQLARDLKIRLPIQPGKGYSLTMPRPELAPRLPLILEEFHVAVTPMESGFRLGSTMEFVGYDSTLNPRRLALLRDGAVRCLKQPYCEPVLEEWCGWRPMTYDELPCIGPIASASNVHVAAGHGMLGVSMAPGTGKLIADLVTGAAPQIDALPFSVVRFGS